MTFNQLEFLFIFLPLAVGGFFMPGLAKFRPWWLVGVSLVFYGIVRLTPTRLKLRFTAAHESRRNW